MSVALTALPKPSSVVYAENDDPALFHRARNRWVLFALCLLAPGNGVFEVASTASQGMKRGSEVYASSNALLMLTAFIWTVCGGLMVTRIGPTLRLMRNQKVVLAFAILAFLSTLWSQYPLLTFRRAMLLFLYYAFGWFFACSYTAVEQSRLLIATGVIVGLASVALAVLVPLYGLDTGGEWRGVFGQKNSLGVAMFFLFSGLAFRRISSRRQLLGVILIAILPISLISLAQSRESFILVLLVIGMRFFGPFLASRRKDQVPFTVYATTLFLLAITFGRGIFLNLLGRDSTLTGRTREWAILLPFAFKHFWLGYGYYAFWTGTGDSLTAASAIGGAIRGSDSGYVDTMLQFGIVGMALWLVFLVASVRAMAKTFRQRSVPLIRYWYVGLIIATFVESFVGNIFTNPSIYGFTVVVAYAGLSNMGRQNASA